MGIFDKLFSSDDMIKEQLFREIESALPEESFIFAITDNQGNVWTNDQETFNHYFSDESHIQRLCSRLDDGAEFVLSHKSDCSIVMSDVIVEDQPSGYAMLAMPGRCPSDIISHIDVYEFALRQITLIASLIRKNNVIHHEQLSRPHKLETQKIG